MTDSLSLESKVQLLLDIEAIKRLRYAYWRCMDTANWPEMESLLHPDFTCRYLGGTTDFVCGDRDEFVRMLAGFFHENIASQHQGHHPEIDILSETEATGRWYLQDLVYQYDKREFLMGAAIYIDRYVKQDGRWLLIDSEFSRTVEVAEPMERPPNFAARLLARTPKPA